MKKDAAQSIFNSIKRHEELEEEIRGCWIAFLRNERNMTLRELTNQ